MSGMKNMLVSAGGVLLIMAGLMFTPVLPCKEAQAAATLSGAKPNIILIVTDDQTFDTVEKMPFLSSRNWVTFPNAFIANPLCCPSRATILTGLHDTHTGVIRLYGAKGGEAFDESQTLAVWLKAANYKTAFFGKYLNKYPWDRGNYVPPGWNEWFAFTNKTNNRYVDFVINHNGKAKHFKKEYSTELFAKRISAFIRESKQPFFIYFAPYAPHTPSIAAPGKKGTHKNTPIIFPPSFNEHDVSDKPAYIQKLPKVSAAEQKEKLRKQLDTLLSVDEAIRDITKALKDREIFDDTVIIFMTDNGYANGEHRWVEKRCPYDICMRTPLIVHYPGHNNRKISKLAGNIDIAPTILELAGASAPFALDGMSLVRLIEQTDTSWRDSLLGHWGGGGAVQGFNPPNYWTIRTHRYRYTEYATGEKELYDYTTDPHELQNVAGKRAYAAIQASLADKLASLKEQEALSPVPTLLQKTIFPAADNTDTAAAVEEEEKDSILVEI